MPVVVKKNTVLKNKIDFVAIITAKYANPNGDPANANMPRTDYAGRSIISQECMHRKIRNRMQDLIGMPGSIFYQTDERSDDGCKSLSKRAEVLKGIKDPDEFVKSACETWDDVRAFGGVFAFKGASTPSVSLRGPITVCNVVSADPVEICSTQIVKSMNGEDTEGRSSDRMGMKHTVKFAAYKVCGAVNAFHSEKTGCTEEDAELIKEALRTLFVNDASAARPDGSMEVVKLYWFKHNCRDGQYSAPKVHNSVKLTLKDGVTDPDSIDDYIIEYMPLEGLTVEEIAGW